MSHQQAKLIDKYARTKPEERQDMQVLALGLSRTGTMCEYHFTCCQPSSVTLNTDCVQQHYKPP